MMDDSMMDAPQTDHESASKMSEAPAPPAKAGWVLDSVTLEPAANGGLIARCSRKQDPMPKDGPGFKSDNYAFTSVDDAVDFLRQEFAGPTASSASSALAPSPKPGY